MRELLIDEVTEVEGGILVSALVVAAAAYAAGYAYGSLTKEEPKPEPCKPNPHTGTQCA